MKSFRSYLAESVRVYRYKIKFAGDLEKNFCDLFCHNLSKFDPVKVSAPKTTPIQRDPYGFPDLKDQPVTIIDVSFRYPATEPMIKQLARMLGHDENFVRMIQADYDESINSEARQYENEAQDIPLLTKEQLEDGGKEASKEYGGSYLGRIKEQSGDEHIEMPYSGKKTKNVFDPFDPQSMVDKAGLKSPMSQIKRQPKPPTGATRSRG